MVDKVLGRIKVERNISEIPEKTGGGRTFQCDIFNLAKDVYAACKVERGNGILYCYLKLITFFLSKICLITYEILVIFILIQVIFILIQVWVAN